MRFIRYLSIVVLLIGLCKTTDAQAQKDAEIELEKIIVTSKRTPVGLGEVTDDVIVVTEEEIKTFPAQDLGEALKYVPGVDIKPRQGFGRANTVVIRNADPRQVRVMIDGIPLNTQTGGSVNVSMIPIENVEKIEVIKGAASHIWGSSLGGVVNVITKDTGDTVVPKGSLTATLSEYRTKKESLDLSGKAGIFSYYLFSSYMESGGEGPRDDVLEKKGFAKVSYDLDDMGKVFGAWGYSGGDINNGVYPDDRTWDAQPYRLRYGKIGWEAGFADDIDVSVELKNSRQDITTKYHFNAATDVPWLKVQYRDILYQLSAKSTMHPRGKDLLVFGADLDWAAIKSSTYFYLVAATSVTTKSLKAQAPYINYTLRLRPWDFNLGLRYDHNSEFGSQLSPSAGVVYRTKKLPDTLFRANVSRAFNAPPLLWKYYESGIFETANNPDIKPERSWVYELGVESKPHENILWKLSLYRADVSNAIASDRNNAGLTYMRNYQKFRRQGIELLNEVNIFEGLDFFWTAAFNDAENRATRETVMDGGKARKSVHIGLTYSNKKGLDASLLGNYDRWNEPASSEAKDRKMLYDLRMSQEYANMSLFLNILNLTNSKYWARKDFPIPPRYFEGGLILKW